MRVRALASIAMLAILSVATPRLSAHCDTMNGPVVSAAREALASGDITPVLKWVPKESEGEARAAFVRTLQVRTASPAAENLADSYFFETVVRLHRAGEGEPYTGLKPATDVDPAVAAADKAIQTGSPNTLVKSLTAQVSAEIQQRFERVEETRKTADQSVEAGRKYVAAYVRLMHYLEQIDEAAKGQQETSK